MENQNILRFKKISKASAIISIFVGGIVLFGWAFDIGVFKSISPNFVTMKANTALAFLLAGLSLLFAQEYEISKPWKKNASRITATLVVLIGLTTLSEYLLGWNLGIDQLFFKESAGAVLTPNQGRMAPMTAINFSIIGISLLFLGHGRQIKKSQYLSLFALIPSLMGIVGYLYGVKEFVGIIPLTTPMSLHAAITFFILAMGIVFSRSDSGLMTLFAGDNLGGIIVRVLIPAKIIILTFLGYIQILWHQTDYIGALDAEPLELMHFRFHAAFFVISAIIVFTVIIWLVAVIVRGIDIEKKLVAEKFKAEKDKTNILLESIGDAVIAIDRGWNIILWNESASKLSGWTKDEVLGKPFRNFIKLIRERNRNENIQFIEHAMVVGQTSFLENHTLLIKKDGEEISVGDSAAPIFNGKKEIIGAIIIMRDTTKEREISMLHSDFAYASHQLRTPITKTSWLLESALKDDSMEKIKKDLRAVYEVVKSIKKLSEELIDVSEIDQGRIISVISTVKLTDFFDDIVGMVNKKALEHEIKIVAPAISMAALINTDQRLLKRVLIEILENAIAYNQKKTEIKINIKYNGDDVIIEIQDSGVGITLEHQPLIFTKFFRGSNFDTTAIAGAGLGLYIAKEYVKLLKGKIWFKSEENKGTTFFVSIPVSNTKITIS